MQTLRWRDWQLSRMMLGTVQFGLPYGIANTAGQPDYPAVRDMVAAALEAGINGFDTAAAYGQSETVLGKALRELKAIDRVLVVTKVRPLPPDAFDDRSRAEHLIRASIDQSRHNLGLDCLPMVLFHRDADVRYLEVLEALRTEGRLRYLGVSAGNEPDGDARPAIAAGRADAVQLPANLLDRRHARSGILEDCVRQEVAVFVRSVFLQGLLLMPENAVPESLRDVLPVRRRLEALAAEADMPMAELAVRYLLGLPGVTCLLTGVETLAQLRENSTRFASGPLPAELADAVEAAVPTLPDPLLTPATWPNSWSQNPPAGNAK